MLLPRVEAVLNPKFGVVISKTTTCRSCTGHRAEHDDDDDDTYLHTPICPLTAYSHYDLIIPYAHYVCEKCNFNTNIASRFGKKL